MKDFFRKNFGGKYQKLSTTLTKFVIFLCCFFGKAIFLIILLALLTLSKNETMRALEMKKNIYIVSGKLLQGLATISRRCWKYWDHQYLKIKSLRFFQIFQMPRNHYELFNSFDLTFCAINIFPCLFPSAA